MPNRNEPLSELTGLEFNQLTICYELLRKKFDSNFKITSFIGSSPKPNGSITPTPTTKQENLCGELKLFNKASSANKAEFESNKNAISNKLNPYSNYQGKFISQSILSIIIC